MPSSLAQLLNSSAGFLTIRLTLTTMFWTSAIEKTLNWQGSIGEMAHFGLVPPAVFAMATIVTLIGGPVLFLSRKFLWLGAGWMAIFTLLTIPIAHNFWAMTGKEQIGEWRTAMEHISVVGGLALAAACSALDQTQSRA